MSPRLECAVCGLDLGESEGNERLVGVIRCLDCLLVEVARTREIDERASRYLEN